jgi:hypothetical protein
MNLCLYRSSCAAVLLWLLAPAVVLAQRESGTPGMGEFRATQQSELSPVGPSQNEDTPSFARRADLALLPELQLGGQDSRWGGRVGLDAASAQRRVRGRCVFALQFEVVNGGQSASAATTHSVGQRAQIRVDASPRQARSKTLVLAQAKLAPSERQRFRVELELEHGSSWLEVSLDTAESVEESIEANNQRRVQLDLDGRCG